MIVIGIDPGLARLGYGVIEVSRGEIQPVCYGIIETSGKDHRASERLLKIYSEIGTLFDKYTRIIYPWKNYFSRKTFPQP